VQKTIGLNFVGLMRLLVSNDGQATPPEGEFQTSQSSGKGLKGIPCIYLQS
jgi:hypothetical protein